MLLLAGVLAFAVAAGIYFGYALTHQVSDWLDPVDLKVYRFGGLIAAHVRPWYQPRRTAPLYEWPGYEDLKFTYTPFASIIFIAATVPPLALLEHVSQAVNTVAMLAGIWVTLAAVGWPVRGRAGQAGITLLVGAALFWTEPVQRVLYLGQIELILMALIMWDLGQPDRRWWKGAGVGLAAGVKLVPLIFIPYLLLTRRFRQAAVATCTFALTVGVGFAVDPADSVRWWAGGLFGQGSRTGFVGWTGNQSLYGLIARLVGSVAGGEHPWLAVALVTAGVGLVSAVLLDRAGYRTVAVLTCALTGVLVSPISWDHHWVWIVPGVTTGVACAAKARGVVRWSIAGLAGLITLVFFGWPGSLWGAANDLGGFSLGLIWAAPNTNPGTYYRLGDRPWFAEYHWHGLNLLAGNLYVLAGIGLLITLAVISVALSRHRRERPSQLSPATQASSIAGVQAVIISRLSQPMTGQPRGKDCLGSAQ